jgi:ABC-type nitrate/sulfonate/bicarbonate transport system ATPase subunit
MKPHEALDKARFWMDRLGLKGFYSYYPRQLSGGMVQRVSIARAFAIEPEIMLLDEPFSNLDTSLADTLLRELRQVLFERRVTAVYVTHDITEALSLAHRIFHLTSGGLEQIMVTDREQMLREYYSHRLKDLSS